MNNTSAEYFTFNAHNSALLIGQTGSGKSYLVHALIKRFIKAFPDDQLKFVIFDLKRVEFQNSEAIDKNYLYYKIIEDADEGLVKLGELADLAHSRAHDNVTSPLLFIYIEECDMAMIDQVCFNSALKRIIEHAAAANIKLIYSTSRPSVEAVSDELASKFDLIISGQITERDADRLHIQHASPSEHQFVVTE